MSETLRVKGTYDVLPGLYSKLIRECIYEDL